jgi:serine/threonine protein kinase
MTKLERYVGQVLDDKYRLERLLGRGGMGAVYLATHLGTERYVALKLITPQFMSNEEFVERFKREARAAGRLRHPNVVDVTDFGFARVDADRVAYLVMEYLDGCTLGDVLAEEKRLPLEWVVDILEQVCSAVHEAHLQGIVHRDLKPDNIWLEPNRLGGYRIKVLDFGIAKLGEAGTAGATVLTGASGALPDVTGPRVTAPATSDNRPSVSASLETETLIYDAPLNSVPDHADQMATQHFVAATSASLEAHEGFDIAPAPHSDDADSTLLFDVPLDIPNQLSAAAGGGATQAAVDADQTLMFDQSTVADASEKPTLGASPTFQGTGLTRVGAIMGTPLYMSPEQCRSAHLDARSDIYSLGVIAYQMLTGDLPFTGNTSAVMSGHLEIMPSQLRERNRKVPKRVSKVVMSALAKDPAERPQTAAAFANALRAEVDGIGALYRRAFALYSEYFPKFLRLSVIAHIPVIITTLAMIALQIAEKSQGKGLTVTRIALIAGLLITALLQVVSYFVAASSIAGVTAIIVTQLQAAPLRPVELRASFAVLKRRWIPFAKTVVRVTLSILLGYILCIIPGIILTVRYALYAPVVLVEGLDKKVAIRRARDLAARSWRTVIIVSLLQILIPLTVSALVGRLSINLHRVSGQPAARIYMQQIYQQLSGLINIVVVPLMSIVSALLYLKMRQLGGETLNSALEQIENVETDRSEWRQRMRFRLTNPTTQGTSSRSGG